jgi:hypothetical protein
MHQHRYVLVRKLASSKSKSMVGVGGVKELWSRINERPRLTGALDRLNQPCPKFHSHIRDKANAAIRVQVTVFRWLDNVYIIKCQAYIRRMIIFVH